MNDGLNSYFLRVRRTEKQTRWLKLEDQTLREDFVEKVKGRTLDGNNSWDMISKIISSETLGETSGKAKENRETWWWDKEVQEAIASKTEKKGRDLNRSEETVREYKEACKIAKQVAKAKSRAYRICMTVWIRRMVCGKQ